MQAIILAAGMGKRLGELTKNNTKCTSYSGTEKSESDHPCSWISA